MRITFPEEIKIDIDETLSTYVGQGFMLGSSVDGVISPSDVIKKSYGNGNYIMFPACSSTTSLGPG